jgi:hypothetical protein
MSHVRSGRAACGNRSTSPFATFGLGYGSTRRDRSSRWLWRLVGHCSGNKHGRSQKPRGAFDNLGRLLSSRNEAAHRSLFFRRYAFHGMARTVASASQQLRIATKRLSGSLHTYAFPTGLELRLAHQVRPFAQRSRFSGGRGNLPKIQGVPRVCEPPAVPPVRWNRLLGVVSARGYFYHLE